jgi:hypothetical protein
MKTMNRKFTTRLLAALLGASAVLGFSAPAEAQEILLTGPLAGAPAVRKLRLHRQGRFEISPTVTFTLLDEYQRTILLGAKIGYNFTDWLQLGAWGAYGGLIQITTGLADQIQEQNAIRVANALPPGGDPTYQTADAIERRLTTVNLGPEFEEQLGGMDWVVAPQLTAIPFRGKLAIFQSIYLDTDLYIFAGPAFVGLTERADCESKCASDNVTPFPMTSRTAIAPTFGLGFSFYINEWAALGFEWRGLPFSWNTGGFDTAGGGKDEAFPDNRITDADQRFHFNQMLSVSFNINLPAKVRVSE